MWHQHGITYLIIFQDGINNKKQNIKNNIKRNKKVLTKQKFGV